MRTLAILFAAFAACGGSGEGTDGGDAQTGDAARFDAAGSDGARGDLAVSGDGSIPPQSICGAPIQPVDTTKPASTVGSGMAGSCTEQGLDAALQKGGTIVFSCGGAAVIPITVEHELRTDVDTVIDGGGMVTLDGGGKVRILRFNHGDYRKNRVTVTLQHLAMRGGMAAGTALPQAPAPCSQGTDTDGGGGAIWMRDGVLHVIDCSFEQNQGAPLGPDVGGGAIYALGSLEVIVATSRFDGNQASNAGAIGMLNSDLAVYDSTFSNNVALGMGGNTIDTGKCTVRGGEIGSGGSGGAIAIDGGDGATVTLCGVIMKGNHANVLGGALFRTPDGAQQTTVIDRSTIDGNACLGGGGAMYLHNSVIQVRASTFSNNVAPEAGAIQSDGSVLDFENATFYQNRAASGLGGAIALFGGTGKIHSCTFDGNLADGGSGLFGAAIAGNPTLDIVSTLFDGNTTQDCGAPMACQVMGGTGASDFQFPMQHVVCNSPDPPCAPGTTFADPLLGPFGDHGGPTETLVPQAGSPAIGAGTSCPAEDQRGVARPANGCAAGAVEAP